MATTKTSELIAAYVPVLHDGYMRLMNAHPEAEVGVYDLTVTTTLDYLRKDIRAMNPEYVIMALKGLGRTAIILNITDLTIRLQDPSCHIVMPDDDLSRQLLASQENPSATVTLFPIFLRWDRDNSHEAQVIEPDRAIAFDESPVIANMWREAKQSSNWWRQVGAVLADENTIVMSTHNSALPTEHTSWLESDPRIVAKKGESIELSIDIHAEAKLIAEAAREGVVLNGKDIYVTTFPCPNCAKLIAMSGIKTCYFVEGYATLDGYRILKDCGIEIIKIDTNVPAPDERSLKPYPTAS